MTTFVSLPTVFLCLLAWILISYGTLRSRVVISGDFIVATHFILWVLPVFSVRIRLDAIEEIRPLEGWRDYAHPLTRVVGSALLGSGAFIRLNAGFFRRVVVFRRDPDTFIKEVKARLVGRIAEAVGNHF